MTIQRIFLFLLLCCLYTPAFIHAEGELDTDFDGDGKVITDLGIDDEAQSIAIQPDGKIVVVGESFSDMLIIRYNEDGSLDNTFSGDGIQTVDFNLGFDKAFAVALNPNGKIIVAGHATDLVTGEDFALARLNANGSLDNTFNGTGRVTTDFGTPLDNAFDMKIQSDGKIVLAGRTCSGGDFLNCDFALARYNTDGNLDGTFGTGGLVQTDFVGEHDEAKALWIHWDGTILAAGFAYSFNYNIGMARFNPDGSPDFAFSGDGKLLNDLGNPNDNDIVEDVLVYPDGRILIAGNSGPFPFDLMVARFHSDGTLDPNFGSDETGFVLFDFFSGRDSAYAMTLQFDDKILVAGYAVVSGNDTDFAVIRLTQNGILDDSFGTGGKVTTDFSGANNVDHAYAMTLQSNGKIVAAGRADADVALARFDNGLLFVALFGDSFEDGVLDPTWTYRKPGWSESAGCLIGIPEKKSAETEAIPAFEGCTECAIYTRMSSRGGPGNKLWLYAYRENKANTVELLMKEESDTWVLKHRVNGSVIKKAKVKSVIEPHVTYTIFLSFDGTQFTLTVDSVPILVMPATATPNGSVGYKVRNTSGVFEWIFAMDINED